LRAVANEYVISLIESTDLLNLLPFYEAIKGLEVKNGEIVIVYDDEKLSKAIKVLVDNVDRQGPGEREALIKLISLLSKNLSEEVHEYPLIGPPFSWFKKIVNDISEGIAITKMLKISYIISSTATQTKIPLFKWVDVPLSNILEAKEEELQVVAVASVILVAHHSLYTRFSYLYSYMFMFVSPTSPSLPSKSLAEAEKQSQIIDRINVINLSTLKLLLDNEIVCYIGTTYESEFLDYGYYITWTSDTNIFLSNLGYFFEHRAKLVCGYGIHKEVTVNLEKKPSITGVKSGIRRTREGVLLGINVRVQNPYPVPITITVIAYPPSFDAVKKILYTLRKTVYANTTTIEAESTKEVFIPIITLEYTYLRRPYLLLPLLPLPLDFDIIINRAVVARTSLLGSHISLSESKHKLYLSVIDGEGRTVGYRGGEIVVEIPGADFIDLGNGTQMAYLPPEVSNFTVLVDASNAIYELENYNLTLISFTTNISSFVTLSMSIKRGEQHGIEVAKLEDKIGVRLLNIQSFNVVWNENAKVEVANVLKGDLNRNGVLDVGDVVLLLKIVAEGKYDYAADINNDGKVDIGDVVLLLKQIAKG